jgi:hypothetical protein
MAKPRLPDLSATGRRYLENTQRARLVSPGVETFMVVRRVPARRLALAALALLALAGLWLWLG